MLKLKTLRYTSLKSDTFLLRRTGKQLNKQQMSAVESESKKRKLGDVSVVSDEGKNAIKIRFSGRVLSYDVDS